MSKTNGNYTSTLDSDEKALGSNRLNNLLQAVADCTSALLADEVFERGINRALAILGINAGADRLGIGEYFSDSYHEIGYIVIQYEWLSSNATSQLHHPKLKRIDCKEFEEDHYKFLSGKHCGGLIETYPEPFQSGQKKLGVKATYAIPIMVERQYWGIIGLDFCQTARELCDAEIAVLKTAATCIASAIQRERIHRAKEEAERTALLAQQKAIDLSQRDCILNITANAAQALLNYENLEQGIFQALQIIGEGIDTDRVIVMEHCNDSTGESVGYVKMLFEWHSASTVSQLHHPDLQQVSYEGIESWYEQLSKGETVAAIVTELPEPIRSGQIEIGVKSMYSVPIMINDNYWGLIGFDDCQEIKQRSETEISILKITATCIGSAIQQSRIRIEREQAERQILLEQQKASQLAESNHVLSLRDKWLEATANAANQLIKIADLNEGMNAALKMLGEGLNCDRVGVMQNFEDDTGESPGFMRLLHEWNSPYATSQILHPKFNQISTEGVEHWLVRLKAGHWIGGLLSELNQPFRDAMAELNVKSTYAVPVFVKDIYWGALGIDYCREPRRLTSAEIALFNTAASCIGCAIYRSQIQQEEERTELAILDERNRMAREIHDTLAQAFTGISLQLEAARNILSTQPEAIQERLLRAKNLAHEGIIEARRSVRALRPEALESSDLATALRQLMLKMLSGTDIKAEIFIEGEPQPLNPEVEVNLFRITQEAITNTLQHAQSSKICLLLIHENDTVHLQIKDDGKGFNPQLLLGEGFGLIGMQERCDWLKGNLTINSVIGKGTEIIVTVESSQ